MNFTASTVDDLLSLESIRGTLIRLEDTIIFYLIERAQFALNPKIYKKGEFKELYKLDFDGSWLEWFLFEIECFHAKARRYTSPDEYPFTPIEQLPPPIINVQEFPSLLHSASTSHPSTNVNSQILRFYIDHIVPKITEGVKVDIKGTGNGVGGDEERDDGNYGSSATRDVEVLQALSRRIHFGMFVSESKFRQAPHDFIPHITSNPPNREALAGLITKPAVEAALLIRLGNKASLYGAELDPQGNLKREEGGEVKGLGQRIKTDEVVKLYRDWVIPLTKEVEVDYLIHRLEGVDQTQIDEWMKAGGRE